MHDVQPGPLFIGGRFPISWAPDHDPLDGALSEVRLWKRALTDGELGMELNSASPPDDLVRWLCFTEEDAESGNTVRNHAVHGPPVLDMKEDESVVSANDAKSKWSSPRRAAVSRVGCPKARLDTTDAEDDEQPVIYELHHARLGRPLHRLATERHWRHVVDAR